MKIYLASSWKNAAQIKDLALYLRECGHEVDAFCDTSTGRYVFSFDKLPKIENMNPMTVLEQEPVQKAFAEDKGWIDGADAVVMILPCGKSAHLEAGYAKGSGKKLVVYQESFPTGEFDVMYGFADLVTDDWYKVVDFLKELGANTRRRRCISRAEWRGMGGAWGRHKGQSAVSDGSPGIAKLSDCRLMERGRPITEQQKESRQQMYGGGWDE